MICARCGDVTLSFICSIFNEQDVCSDCKVKETQHPLYKDAVRAEHEAVTRGEFNFLGIGLPDDLNYSSGERRPAMGSDSYVAERKDETVPATDVIATECADMAAAELIVSEAPAEAAVAVQE